MPNTQQALETDSGLGKLIAVGMVLLLPVILLALLMPAVQSARESARRASLKSEGANYLESGSPARVEAAKPSRAAAKELPRAIVKQYDAEISLTPKLSVGTAMPESIYVADFKAKIEAQAPKDSQGKCQLELPFPPQIISLGNLNAIAVIAWRVISLFGLWRGLFGGVVVPLVLMGLAIFATIHAKPATQGVALTVMGVFVLVSAMTLLPKVQANLARKAEGRGTFATHGPAIA